MYNVVPLDLTATPCSALECAVVKVTSRLKSALIVCIYRPPSSKAEWEVKFNECLDYLHSLNLPLLIAGDFNVNLRTNDSFAEDLKACYSLKQVIKEATRVTQKSCTLIDHIYISNDIALHNSGVFNLHLSDHLATYAQICNFGTSIKSASSHAPALTYRSTKHLDQQRLLTDLSTVPWHEISNQDTVDDALYTFETLLTEVWDVYAPRKRKQRQRKNTPWMIDDVLNQIRRRNKLYSLFQRNNSDANWMAYKQARNYATNCIRMAKRNYLLSTAADSQKFWKIIKQCTGLNRKRQIEPPWPRSSPAISKITSDTINKFFTSTIEQIASAFSPSNDGLQPVTSSAGIKKLHGSGIYSIRLCSSDDVTKAVNALAFPATTRTDNISLQLLKISLPAVATPIANIFNMLITTTTFPSSWKIGQVVPIYKKGNCASFASYRPVTLLPLLSKAMEHIVHQQLKAYLDEQQVLSSAPHGFRSKRSCCSALLTISNNLSAAKNDGRFSAIAALDYTWAFDTINHEILLPKLAAINFDYNSLSWFSSYLSGRQQYISYNSAQSD